MLEMHSDLSGIILFETAGMFFFSNKEAGLTADGRRWTPIPDLSLLTSVFRRPVGTNDNSPAFQRWG